MGAQAVRPRHQLAGGIVGVGAFYNGVVVWMALFDLAALLALTRWRIKRPAGS